MRPTPSPYLIGGSTAVVVVLCGGAGLALWAATTTFSVTAIFLFVILAVFGALVAYGQYRGVHRQEVGVCDAVNMVYVAILAIAVPVSVLGLFEFLAGRKVVWLLVLLIAGGAGALALTMVIMMTRWATTLRRHERFSPDCPLCGYDLTGSLVAGRLHCPECGQRVSGDILMRFEKDRSRPAPQPDETAIESAAKGVHDDHAHDPGKRVDDRP